MPSSEYIAEVKAAITITVAEATLINLTRQRANEVGDSEPPEEPQTVNDAVLTQAVKDAYIEVADLLGAEPATGLEARDLHIKYVGELTIAELATTRAINISAMGLASKDDILKRVKGSAERAVLRKPRIEQAERQTGWKEPPSGFNPFEMD